MGHGEQLRVMNPVGYPPNIEEVQMAERPGSLDGQTVYLIDVRFDDSDRFLRQMELWMREHLPQVNPVFVSKRGVYTQPDTQLYEEIRDKGALAVVGVGH